MVFFGGRDLEWVRSGKNADGTGRIFTEKPVGKPYTKPASSTWIGNMGKARPSMARMLQGR
jgi:hypothetical protein